MQETESFHEWAIVEMFGHTRIAGLVTEPEIGAGDLIRLDVPQDNGSGWAFTKYIGTKAIYSINIVSESIAREAAKRFQAKPVYGYELPQLQQADDPDTFDISY